jgi:hypothetical protein
MPHISSAVTGSTVAVKIHRRSPRCPLEYLLALSEAPLDVRRGTSIMPKATHFRLEIARRKGATDTTFRGPRITYIIQPCR